MFSSVHGTATIRTPSQAFLTGFVRRIETGLFGGTRHWRCRYVVNRVPSDGLQFRAADWPTALNVGLNDVELHVSADGNVRYAIRYLRWSSYVLALGAVVGFALILVLARLDIRAYIARHPASAFPGLSMDQNVAIAWALVVFWGFVWPWILIAMHRRPLRRLMNRLIAEVDAAVA